MIFDHIELNSSFALWNEILMNSHFCFCVDTQWKSGLERKKAMGVLVVLNCTNTFPEPQNQKNKYLLGKNKTQMN